MSSQPTDKTQTTTQESQNQSTHMVLSSEPAGVDAMSKGTGQGSVNTRDMAEQIRLDEISNERRFIISQELLKNDQRYRFIWAIFSIIAAVGFLIIGFWTVIHLQTSGAELTKLSVSTPGYTAAWVAYALEITRARIVLGFLLGAFLAVIGVGVIMEGLQKSAGELEHSIGPELLRLRQKQATYRLLPGIVLIVCATILLSLSLFSRLPGGPITPPPAEETQKAPSVGPDPK